MNLDLIPAYVIRIPAYRPGPLVYWAGSKSWLLPTLKAYWEQSGCTTLVELFAGSMALSLDLCPKHVLVNDNNKHLINLYRYVRMGLQVEANFTPTADDYYSWRNRFNDLISMPFGPDTIEAARLFFLLNRTGHRGLCRFNKRGEYNVPWGHRSRIDLTAAWNWYRECFQSWCFTSTDFRQVLIPPGSFVYADPPYDLGFTEYTGDTFSYEDQLALAQRLSKHDGPVIVSNRATRRMIDLYHGYGFQLRTVTAQHKLAHQPVQELLAYKF